MAVTIASRRSPAWTEEPRHLFRYGWVVLASAGLHFALWHFRGALEPIPEPRPQPVRIIEVSLSAAPPPAAKAAPEPPPAQKQAPKTEKQPPRVAPKPLVPPPPKSPPKPKPVPRPKAEPKPEPMLPKPPPPAASEAPARPSEAAPATSRPPATETKESSAVPKPRANAGEGKVEETAHADYLHNPKPVYPAVARSRQWEGRVLLKVRVRADGTCGQVEVSQSSGHEVLDEAALEAVRNWRFSPAKRGGQAVESWVSVPIHFKSGG